MNDPVKHFTWLPFLKTPVDCDTPAQTAQAELAAGLAAMADAPQVSLSVDPGLGESWEIKNEGNVYTVTGGETGVLYGVYRLLMALNASMPCPTGLQKPFYGLRMLNCWDNADGDIERGYSGRSLFFEGGKLAYEPARIRQLARMLASVGLNVLCINNVNVRNPAHKLIEEEWLPQAAELAALVRPFGIRLMFSIDYAHPMRHGIGTADPLDADVQAWWMQQTALVYKYIPDLAGFLVKADSEHRPGPFTYGRNHADGANMLARALKPHGGMLVWRCFVYNCQQDWRDYTTDRPMAAHQHYAYLDGTFESNVILQIKHGPFDFQVREPVSPQFYAMPKTNLALELQLAQEYTGQQIDIYTMPPMWKELFEQLPPEKVMSIAAVTNLGRDENYTGHPFAAVNLFSYGLFAWDPSTDPEEAVRFWARLTYRFDSANEDKLTKLLMGSRRTYEKYTAPLGICWMVNPNHHYGPNPEGYEYAAWGCYIRADRNGVGIDRTETGTGYAKQYPEEWCRYYSDLATCPDELKLFFHYLHYEDVLSDGRTLIQRIYDDHFEGYEEVEQMAETLKTLPLPSPDKEVAAERMERQLINARNWCDIVNNYFCRLSGVEDAKGRKIYH